MVVVRTAAFHARVRGSGFGSRSWRFERNKHVSSPFTWKTQYCGEPPWPKGSVLGLRPPGLESCIWRTVSSHLSHQPQGVAQFSLYVHKGGLKLDSFHFLRHYSLVNVESQIEICRHFWSLLRSFRLSKKRPLTPPPPLDVPLYRWHHRTCSRGHMWNYEVLEAQDIINLHRRKA